MKKGLLLFFSLVFILFPLFGASAEGLQTEGADMMWITWIGSTAALIFALILALYILKKDAGNEKTKEISKHIQEGAIAYLKQQYLVVAIFFIFLFIFCLKVG